MSFLESMQWRYSTKRYNSSKKVAVDKMEELKEILRLSPSSINSQPWNFTFVNDADLKDKLAEASYFNEHKIKDCDTLVVFNRVDNLEFFEEQIENSLPDGSVEYYKDVLKPLPKKDITAWFDKQVYLSIGVLLSACAQMKIDATPMEGIDAVKYNEILGHEDYHSVVAVAVGYRDEDDSNQVDRNPKSRLPIEKVVTSI
ncbi:nitroreductase family protein [Nonlabens sp.]|uniref:nitroreductase family protein n=1 Tax=Nonlabens sp. TaxID=1888209 RepID=UPI0032667881